MADHNEGFRRIDPALVTRQTFRLADARQIDVIRDKLATANLGGLLVTADPVPQQDMVAELLFRVAPQTPLLSGVGLVVRTDAAKKLAAVQLLRMMVCEDPADTPPPQVPDAQPAEAARAAAAESAAPEPAAPARAASRILQEGSTLTLVGDFNVKTTEAFNASWLKLMECDGQHMTIDLTRVQRISSMAIGLLVSAQMDAMQVQRTLTVRVPVALERIFRVSRVDKVLRFVYVSPDGGGDEMVGSVPPAPPRPPDTQTYLRQIEERERDRRPS